MKKYYLAPVFFTLFPVVSFANTAFAESETRNRLFIIIIILLIFFIGLLMIAIHILLALRRKNDSAAKPMEELDYTLLYMDEAGAELKELYDEIFSAPAEIDGNVDTPSHEKRSKFMELEKTIRKLVVDIPAGLFFDVHVIVEKLLQEHDGVYLTNVGQYTSAAQYHAKISTIISQETALVEMAGKSYSKNIHEKFSECHLFKRKSTTAAKV